MMPHGWLVAIGGFLIGVGLESVFAINLELAAWLTLIAFGLGLIWSRSNQAGSVSVLFLVSVVLLAVALGLIRTHYFEAQFDNSWHHELGKEVVIEGLVAADPDVRSNQQLLTVKTGSERLLVSTDRTLSVRYGDTVRVVGELEIPESFTTDLGRTFNYATYLKAKRIEYRISFAEVEVLKSGGGNPVLGFLLKQKHRLITGLNQVLAEPAGSLADGLLLGLNQGLGEQLEQDFRRSGIIHIVVLSGHNVMLVVTFVLFVLALFLPKKVHLVAGLMSIIGFALTVGLSATVVRASIMAGLFLVAQSLGRTYAILRSLIVAGVLMVFINPYLLLYDIGFQLSFMATLGLVAALPWLTNEAHFEIMASAKGYVVATIATQIAVLPLLVYHIGEISLVAVAVNVLVLPVVPFAMLGSFVAGTLWYVLPTIALATGYLTQILLSYIIVVASFFANLPFATVQVGAVMVWWVPVLYGGLFLLYRWVIIRRESSDYEFSDWEIVEEVSLKTKVGAD
jgi:competence protein ComEC